MLKRWLFVAAAVVVLSVNGQTEAEVKACAEGTPCSQEWEYCEETAEAAYGQYQECCTGHCLRVWPYLLEQCNNDSNQCYCRDIEK